MGRVSKKFAVIEARHIQRPRYDVQRVWRYGSKRHVIPLPDSWRNIHYVLIREDEEGLLVLPLEGIKNDSEAAQIAAELNHRLEAREHE